MQIRDRHARHAPGVAGNDVEPFHILTTTTPEVPVPWPCRATITSLSLCCTDRPRKPASWWRPANSSDGCWRLVPGADPPLQCQRARVAPAAGPGRAGCGLGCEGLLGEPEGAAVSAEGRSDSIQLLRSVSVAPSSIRLVLLRRKADRIHKIAQLSLRCEPGLLGCGSIHNLGRYFSLASGTRCGSWMTGPRMRLAPESLTMPPRSAYPWLAIVEARLSTRTPATIRAIPIAAARSRTWP